MLRVWNTSYADASLKPKRGSVILCPVPLQPCDHVELAWCTMHRLTYVVSAAHSTAGLLSLAFWCVPVPVAAVMRPEPA